MHQSSGLAKAFAWPAKLKGKLCGVTGWPLERGRGFFLGDGRLNIPETSMYQMPALGWAAGPNRQPWTRITPWETDDRARAQARAVESSGASSQERPSNEDVIGSSIVISLNAIEIIYQPNWCFAPLDD